MAVDVVRPQALGCAGLGVGGEQRGTGAQVLEIFEYDCGFVRRPRWAVTQGGDEAARVDVEEGLGLLVGVDFDVLIGEPFVLERDPDALDERTK